MRWYIHGWRCLTASFDSTGARSTGLTSKALLQVEDCTRDVCELSTYHFRYRICNVHIRLPAFMRQGKLQRFCQQCGRCHELSEFEGNQRSCRAQLDRHNARSAHMVPLAMYMHLHSFFPALPERACHLATGALNVASALAMTTSHAAM